MSISTHVLPATLELAVSVHALNFIKQDYVPDCTSIAHELTDIIAHQGDVLLFGGQKPGESAVIFNNLAYVIACLSFRHGGVRLFGIHFQNHLSSLKDE